MYIKIDNAEVTDFAHKKIILKIPPCIVLVSDV